MALTMICSRIAGMRSVPTQQELKAFVEKVEALDHYMLAQVSQSCQSPLAARLSVHYSKECARWPGFRGLPAVVCYDAYCDAS